MAQYDLKAVANTLRREEVRARSGGMWRWREVLPLLDAACRFSLGEGDTPLLRLERIGGELGLRDIFLKDEGLNPTGSFKARGLAMAVSKAIELGAKGFVIPTAGNAGGALAAYAARAHVPAHVFMPADARGVYQLEVKAAGGELHLVEGLIDEAGRQAASFADEHGYMNLATFREPFRVEGKKTMGYELAEHFEWSLPEVIIYPTGGGTGLVGMWKAFQELEELGWVVGERPRMISVQSEGCAPVVRAMERGEDRIEYWQNAATRAEGLRVPGVFADVEVLASLRESGGTALAVSEEEIEAAQKKLAQEEGVSASKEGAAPLAGLIQLVGQKLIGMEERIVLFNTATGLKDVD